MEAGRRDEKIKPFIAALKFTKVVLYMEGAWYSSNREPLWSIVRLPVL
jgi:hypothetical protein